MYVYLFLVSGVYSCKDFTVSDDSDVYISGSDDESVGDILSDLDESDFSKFVICFLSSIKSIEIKETCESEFKLKNMRK